MLASNWMKSSKAWKINTLRLKFNTMTDIHIRRTYERSWTSVYIQYISKWLMHYPLASKGIAALQQSTENNRDILYVVPLWRGLLLSFCLLWLYILHFTVKQKAKPCTNDSSLKEHKHHVYRDWAIKCLPITTVTVTTKH